MNTKKLLVNITFMFLYYLGIIVLSIIPVLFVMNLEYEKQRYILEDILGGDAGIGGYGVFGLYYLFLIFSFITSSIIVFIILNIIIKKYSYLKMIIITIVFSIIYILINNLTQQFIFILFLLLLPLVQMKFSNKK